MPRVSIILTTHDGRLEKCKLAVDSVLAQSFNDWELIIIDDHSKDGTREWGFEKIDARVQYHYRKENYGNHSKPKNEGILLSQGELICFLDSDNQYRPDHLQALVNALEQHPEVDIAYGDRWIMDEQGVIPPQIGVTSDYNPWLLMLKNYIDTSDFMIRRPAMLKLGGWDESEKRMLDWQLMVRAAKAGMKFHHVPLILTDYYLHSKQLSHSMDGLNEDGSPTWNMRDCNVSLPYLGLVNEPKVGIFTLTYDRLEETKVSFDSLRKTAGYPFTHFVIDNGSTDGTREYLHDYKDLHRDTVNLTLNRTNQGISIASNQAINQMVGLFDIIMKVDNDAVFMTEGWLKAMVEIWKANRLIALSPYVQGLRDNPGGAPRVGYGEIKGEQLGLTHHLGGICHFVDASAYKDFRWNENSFLHGIQDLEFSNYLKANGYQMAYMENHFVNHGVDGTEGQMKRYADYFERRKSEKTTRPEKDYKKLQEEESALSRGTIWGDRIKDSITRFNEYITGRVLDIGCGDGYSLELHTANGHEVVGIDISTPKVKLATMAGFEAYEGVMEKLPFEDKEFDTVFCSHTLEHSADLTKACQEIQRVAKRAVIIVPIEETTNNPGHTSPIKSKEYLLEHFSNYTIIHEEELARLEQEQVLILDFA